MIPTSPEFQKVHIHKHQFVLSPVIINWFLQRNVPENVSEQRPSLRDLVFELTKGAWFSWPKKGQLPTTVLSVKYALLHKIGITNWCPSSHRSSLSISLATLIYQIDIKSQFNYGAFVLNQIKRHIGFKAPRLPVYYPGLVSGGSSS